MSAIVLYSPSQLTTLEIKYWVLAGLTGILLTALGWILNSIAQRTLSRLDAILTELQKLTNMMTKHEAQIENIYETLKDHDSRLRDIERAK